MEWIERVGAGSGGGIDVEEARRQAEYLEHLLFASRTANAVG